MTGSQNYLTRQEFTEESAWRGALGQETALLLFADTGYCLDAPDYIPSGARSCRPCEESLHRLA